MNYSDIAERIVKVLASPGSGVGLASQGSADTDFSHFLYPQSKI
ncbi:hypothetical protein ACSJL2_001444 [Serratia sarumanii]|uniref:Uncharacterized protein n=2 Tax=Serratia TaxID=613 RepID=A0ABD5BET4_SERMA|nr:MULTISPECIES: hypothetical protein [Serratia]MCS1372791.1 hypothetical protein [Serratia marcescens]MDE5233957.1 hypothetical protein [Serratia marcescens]MDE5257876.1 hypothetical protein [Serratia marcescens]MDP8024781.1 hypothetical protein [Serratia marcescens]MDP8649571.1 hypothetical protein [Serratia marcescens]